MYNNELELTRFKYIAIQQVMYQYYHPVIIKTPKAEQQIRQQAQNGAPLHLLNHVIRVSYNHVCVFVSLIDSPTESIYRGGH